MNVEGANESNPITVEGDKVEPRLRTGGSMNEKE